MPSQTEAGKAFEFALVAEAYMLLQPTKTVTIIQDSSYNISKYCFYLFNDVDKKKYSAAAKAAVTHILEIEPKIQFANRENDELIIKIAPDAAGISGDVRDILFMRPAINWEVGISAKNNHRAVKHSRLSDKIDFGKEWLSLNCSANYFDRIRPVFAELRLLRESEELWRNLANKAKRFYIPILESFKLEMLRLDQENPGKVPATLLTYLIGNKDFYKVIKRPRKTEIFAFQLHGSLNQTAEKEKPKFKVNKLKLPSRIIEITLKPNSSDTLILTCDEGWQISFRIHNASSKVEPSLKFDINLIGQPQNLYSNHIHW